jgi:hypothetical protein
VSVTIGSVATVDGLLVDTALAVLTGVGLWALLPRSVVLTRAIRAQKLGGEPLNDTWELKNDSPLPIRITSVAVMDPSSYDDSSGKMLWAELKPDAEAQEGGISLHFYDSVTEIRRLDCGRPWKGTIVPPGDTLTATVLNNRDLRIRYRRAGTFGVFERREVKVHGGT